jgi:lipid-binding SYLF domain-containing protein
LVEGATFKRFKLSPFLAALAGVSSSVAAGAFFAVAAATASASLASLTFIFSACASRRVASS